MDGDDEITPDSIEKQVCPVLKDKSIEMVIGYFERCYTNSTGLPCKRILEEQEISSLEAVHNYIFDRKSYYVYVWNKLIKKDFITKNGLYFNEGF